MSKVQKVNLTSSQVGALKAVQGVYTDTPMILIGATALGSHIDLARQSDDIDLAVSVPAENFGAELAKLLPLRMSLISRLVHDASPLARTCLKQALEDWPRALVAMHLADQKAYAAEFTRPKCLEEDVLRAERGDEKPPRTVAELFEHVRRHLGDVGTLLVNDDFSYRTLFIGREKDDEGHRKPNETEIQLWVGSALRQRARGLYSVVRENEVDHGKRVDISAYVAGVGTVPVEIKPIGGGTPYGYKNLQRTVRDQLAGQYMRSKDRTHGILLLVQHAPKKSGWTIDGAKKQSFGGLHAALRTYARDEGLIRGRTISVEAIDIEASRKNKKARF